MEALPPDLRIYLCSFLDVPDLGALACTSRTNYQSLVRYKRENGEYKALSYIGRSGFAYDRKEIREIWQRAIQHIQKMRNGQLHTPLECPSFQVPLVWKNPPQWVKDNELVQFLRGRGATPLDKLEECCLGQLVEEGRLTPTQFVAATVFLRMREAKVEQWMQKVADQGEMTTFNKGTGERAFVELSSDPHIFYVHGASLVFLLAGGPCEDGTFERCTRLASQDPLNRVFEQIVFDEAGKPPGAAYIHPLYGKVTRLQ